MDGLGSASAMEFPSADQNLSLSNSTELSKALTFVSKALPNGCAYIGVQFIGDKLAFYRTSQDGVVFSKNLGTEKQICVYLKHFQERLAHLPFAIQVSVADSGILRLFGPTSATGSATMFVHTKDKAQSGLTKHEVGGRKIGFNPQLFRYFDVSKIKNDFRVAIKNGRMAILANHGSIFWTPPFPIDTDIPPTANFLRLVSGDEPVTDLSLTVNGYWGAVIGDFVVYLYGQGSYVNQFAELDVPATPICQFTAEQLLIGLRDAAAMSGDTGNVDFDPTEGIVIHDPMAGTPSSWSLDVGAVYPKFRIQGAQAALIANILRQAEGEDMITLSNVETASVTTYRFTRGVFEVNVRLGF